MSDFTFIKEEELQSNSNNQIFDTYGTISAISDFAILLGGDSIDSQNESLEGRRAGFWWTSSVDGMMQRCAVYADGFLKWEPPYPRMIGARPSISYQKIKDDIKNVKNTLDSSIIIAEYGEYPQTIAPIDISTSLEELYQEHSLEVTGKIYSADDTSITDTYAPFKYRHFIEYEYKNEKYIRFVADFKCNGEVLSDEREVEMGKPYWLKVEPIKWLIDKSADTSISEQILFAGVAMDNDAQHIDDDFNNTNMKWFIDNYFANEMIPSKMQNNTISSERKLSKKENPYNFDFSEVTEEDIIKCALESGVSVFLHGKSGDGKSDRVRSLDPDLEIIYLRNATPDSLNGKSVFNSVTNKMIDIPPTWYKKVVDKCVSEPDKIHIVFFDEISNALPSIQGMAFNIVLDGEVNGKWKLPPNARIVAAGNEYEESKSANDIAEPLFNRFAHVYIETTVDSWLKWAVTGYEVNGRLEFKEEEKHPKIHPAIYAYIAYKSFKGDDVLRTPYNGKTPNADPRKWELSSKLLYKTNMPETLRALIGRDLTNDFVAFTKKQVLTVEDVIKGNYTEDDLIMDVGEKFATAVGLSSAPIEHIEVVRNFVMKLGSEICATFDTLWINGDETRLERIAEIKMSKEEKIMKKDR